MDILTKNSVISFATQKTKGMFHFEKKYKAIAKRNKLHVEDALLPQAIYNDSKLSRRPWRRDRNSYWRELKIGLAKYRLLGKGLKENLPTPNENWPSF